MSARTVAETYFSNMRARDIDALEALFAENGVMVLPDGRELDGPAAIRTMYEGLFKMSPPSPTPVVIVDGGPSVAACEIEARMENGDVRRTANFFHLNDAGRIQRLSIYRRG